MTMLTIAHIGDTRIAVEGDVRVEPGHQWILIADEGVGLFLAELLMGEDAADLCLRQGWYYVAHTAEVDERLRALVDAACAIRRAAPGLVQLTLTGVGDDE